MEQKTEPPEESPVKEEENVKPLAEEASKQEEIKYFECALCHLRERYEYFGREIPISKHFEVLEKSYVIEDPFSPPKKGEFLILGSHCIKCNRSVCKDQNCSLYFDGTYCIPCAKNSRYTFPENVQEKLNRIVTNY